MNENVIAKKQDISLSRPLGAHLNNEDSQNFDPNRGDMTHQSIWAEELRRADERTIKFKQDLADGERRRLELA